MDQPTQPKYPDAYTDFGLKSNASSTEVKAAYRTLALLHHPDKNMMAPGKANDADEFRRVDEAYELLKDEDTEARYDRQNSNVQAQWTKYNADLAEYSQNLDAWR
jgi:DnaJ-class molecular chaperone